MILAPTRELAVQIKEECGEQILIALLGCDYNTIFIRLVLSSYYFLFHTFDNFSKDKFGGSSDVKNTVVYGGIPKARQVRDLRSGIEIVVSVLSCFFPQ